MHNGIGQSDVKPVNDGDLTFGRPLLLLLAPLHAAICVLISVTIYYIISSRIAFFFVSEYLCVWCSGSGSKAPESSFFVVCAAPSVSSKWLGCVCARTFFSFRLLNISLLNISSILFQGPRNGENSGMEIKFRVDGFFQLCLSKFFSLVCFFNVFWRRKCNQNLGIFQSSVSRGKMKKYKVINYRICHAASFAIIYGSTLCTLEVFEQFPL